MAGRVLGSCVDATPYTGSNQCAKGESLTTALLFHNPLSSYPLDAATFITDLPAKVYTTGIDRIYPVKNILALDLTGGDTNTSDAGSGYTSPTNKAQVIATYTLENDDCLYKELVKMQGISWRVFRVDQDGYIYGTVTGTGANQAFRGFQCKVAVRRVQATGTDQAFLYLEIYYSAQYEAELKNLHGFNLGEENIPDGLVAVVVDGGQVVGECSGVDYTTIYGPEWTAAMFISSTGTPPDSVTYDDATGLLTFDPTGTYRVADAAVLGPLGITGITGVPLTT